MTAKWCSWDEAKPGDFVLVDRHNGQAGWGVVADVAALQRQEGASEEEAAKASRLYGLVVRYLGCWDEPLGNYAILEHSPVYVVTPEFFRLGRAAGLPWDKTEIARIPGAPQFPNENDPFGIGGEPPPRSA